MASDFLQLMKDGYLEMLMNAGVRLLELACGPCCAIGQSPATKGVAVRTSNRNFKGRQGSPTGRTLLMSPAMVAAAALTGKVSDARDVFSLN